MKLLVTLILIGIVSFSLLFDIDSSAMELHDEVLQRSVVAFGLAKGLNGVISLIQGTELSITPLGMGLTISVGEILDPLNDMVERFSWIMLLSSVSLGIQKILLVLSSKLFLQIALMASVAASITLMWVNKFQESAAFTLSLKIFFFMLILRFGAIFFVYSSNIFYNSVLEVEYAKSTQMIQTTQKELDEIQASTTTVSEYKTLAKKLESIKENIEESYNNIINLITIFVVQTIVMPLLFLWLFVSLIRFVFTKESFLLLQRA